MIEMFGPTGALTMNDVLVTLAAFFAAWTKYAQKAKDEQLAARDETIAFLKRELEECRKSKMD